MVRTLKFLLLFFPMCIFHPIDHFQSIFTNGIFEFFAFFHSIFGQFFWITDLLSWWWCNIFQLFFLRFTQKLLGGDLNPIQTHPIIVPSLLDSIHLRCRHFIFDLKKKKPKPKFHRSAFSSRFSYRYDFRSFWCSFVFHCLRFYLNRNICKKKRN